MSEKNKKQFGVWMDSHHATIAGRKNIDEGDFVILDHVENNITPGNSNENAANNHEIGLTNKFFKEILSKVPNMSSESTSNKMSDERLLVFISNHFN